MTPHEERLRLLGLARHAIATWFGGGRFVPDESAAAGRCAGAFVTLQLQGALRGCIGKIEADSPLDAVIARCAVAAASADPRFPPLTLAEFEAVAIEVSVLSPPEPVRGLDDIVVGRHGLIVTARTGRGLTARVRTRRGLLLPQVAAARSWDAAAFVAETCRKAGLPPDAWPGRGVTLDRFEAEVFGEAD